MLGIPETLLPIDPAAELLAEGRDPTRRGRDVHGRALRAARLVEADLLDALTPAERTALRDLLRRTVA